ncbi:hypothetical protein [Streptomyces sp. NPDC059649]|uniref:hypothetical protein n=1 Tax=Streptomyces sp. NPDC059649 TaxID=3346895 RepID=UPI0036CAA9A6
MSMLPAGGGRHLTPNRNGGYTVTELPVEQPTEDEHRIFTRDGYYGLSHLELMRRLHKAEWDAAEWKRQLDEHRAGARYQRTADAQALARVAGLVDVRRKTLRMWDLRCALGLIPWEEQQAAVGGNTA